ncbi:putative membrane protein YabM [Pullulanibacillus pueri]|uniref:Putative membrane protein YabM n=1 Tax=Pullulanibacillus pueri TaxID=1437324 RepID=A0A8J3ER03_9BACL|nr:putative membrane protein YabM [Pullulanibacillus pueri]
MRGAFILTAAAFIIKVLSAVYRLPYQNLAGDIGFYVYQQVYPFYAFAVTMAGFGFPVVLSRMISEARMKQGQKGVQTVFATAASVLSIVGLFLFLLLFLGAPFIASLMQDALLVKPLHMISFIFLWMPLLALFRGYFQGLQDMKPTGISQVAEQALRVTLILGLSFYLFYKGSGPYTFGTAAAFGSMIAPVASTFFLLLFFYKTKGSSRPQIQWHWDFKVVKRFLFEGLAYTVASLAIVLFQFVDTLTLVPFLNDQVNAARELKGIYDRSFPFIQMGMMTAVALATSAVPVLAQIKGESKEHVTQWRQPLRLAIIFGSAAAVGLFLIVKETNIFLFEDSSGSLTLAIMVLNILSASIIITSATQLQGLGRIWLPMILMVAAACVKLGLNGLLIPSMGILGAGLATTMSLFGLSLLLLGILKKEWRMRLFHWKEYGVLGMANLLIMVVVFLWKTLLHGFVFQGHQGRIEAGLIALSSAVWGGFIFLFFIARKGLLEKEDIEQFPFGGMMVKLLFKNQSVRRSSDVGND